MTEQEIQATVKEFEDSIPEEPCYLCGGESSPSDHPHALLLGLTCECCKGTGKYRPLIKAAGYEYALRRELAALDAIIGI